ncbi:MAG: hypothetical protein LHW64_05325 [Candidatus Cloacimonetes bacterium]|jgi:hypothetical protein|nr:hypothetical protein [Candidatus Cloacimonadota bacterium]MCB5287203.1 hypothetical protein [Candidatus Cloacimonadota bacterium]MCK9184491.1 hypothetical protein [Candidatus Cloacimonadota bacterium]MCK9583313.1 hypothetical protein [Candidatus Cloacimonadota bacterium]MDY0229524.1 hypothetical protein [Candidatus Cloacimonadaceae bacterium]
MASANLCSHVDDLYSILQRSKENLAYETHTVPEHIFHSNFKAFEAEMYTSELYLKSFQAFNDTPVGKIRPENVIPQLNALRDSGSEV